MAAFAPGSGILDIVNVAPTPDGWTEQHLRGDAAGFHARPIPDELTPSLWWFEVDRPAIVLGSAQPIEHLDLVACERAGIDVVRRRSGGGAVLLEPGDVTWVDVLIPTTHHHWTPDVTSSAWWLGEVWRATVADLGVRDATVHAGPMVVTPWSSRICFAGVGGGELVATSRPGAGGSSATSKIVGISQRRTRSGARFQCAVYRHWRPQRHRDLFAGAGPSVDDLADVVTTIDAPPSAIRDAFVARLARS